MGRYEVPDAAGMVEYDDMMCKKVRCPMGFNGIKVSIDPNEVSG